MTYLHNTGDTSIKRLPENEVRLFESYLLWAPFAVSGPSTQVHPHGIVEPVKKKKEVPVRSSILGNLFKKKNERIHTASTESQDRDAPTGLAAISDIELRREAKILRSEGGVELADAAEAELKRRRQAKVDEVKRR